jgi:YbgC/YbaW family acyl-CoA thioester hydrolase
LAAVPTDADSRDAAEGHRADQAPRPASILVQRRVEWRDTDASGAYHNSVAFSFIETAETALFDRLGFLDDVYGRLPRAHLEADFLEPLWHRDLCDIRLTVTAVGRTSVTYDVTIESRGEACVRARSVAVLLDRIGGTPQPWPDEHRRLLQTAGPQAPELLVDG